MALSPSEWEAIQERAVNPFRTNEANAVNRLTRIITLGDDVILKDENIEQVDYKTIKVKSNSYVKDDVYIQFDQDVDMDFTDEDNYISRVDKGMDREGTYYLVLHYVYNESIPNPQATFTILKRKEEFTQHSLLLAECIVVYNEELQRFEISEFITDECVYVYAMDLRKHGGSASQDDLLALLNFCSANHMRERALKKRVDKLERKLEN